MKICVAASSGGHLTQLLHLRPAYEHRPHFWVTTASVAAGSLGTGARTYVVGEANRRQPLRLARVFLRVVLAVARERPDVVLSTGAAPGCLACLVGRVLGARIVWVDSIANVDRLSLSARIVRPYASAVLTQWPEVAARHDGVEYAGALL